MQLSPVPMNAPKPAYPARKRESLRRAWLRKAVSTAAVALALGFSACSGGPGDGLPIGPDVGLAGVSEEPWPAFYFVCGMEEPDSLPQLSTHGHFFGELCGDETAWAAVTITEQAIYQLHLISGAGTAVVAIHDPGGEQIAQLDGDRVVVNLEMTPGTWIVAVDPADSDNYPYELFELSIQPL